MGKMRGACLRAAVAVLLLVVATDAAESTAGIDMIVPLPTQSDDYVSYIQELVDEFAPGPDPKLHEDSAAFGGVMYHAEQEAKQIDRQSKKDAAQMVKAKAALVAAQKRVADAEAVAMKAKAGETSAAEETEKAASATKVEKTQKSAEENPSANVVKTERKVMKGHTHKVAETAADKKLLGPDSIKVDAKTEQVLQAVEHTWKERTDKPKKAIVPSKKTQHALPKTTQPEHVKAKDEKVNAKTEKKLEAIEKQWKEHEAHIEAKQQKKWDAIAKGTTAKKATAKPKKAAKTKTKKVSKKESPSHRVQKDTALVKAATAEENKLNKEAAAAEKDSASQKKKATKAGVSDAREKQIVAAEHKAEAKGETYKVPESKHGH